MSAASKPVDLQFNMEEFWDKVQAISRRGNLTLDLMLREGADPARLNHEEEMLRREILDLRIRTTQTFGERLSQLIKESGLQ